MDSNNKITILYDGVYGTDFTDMATRFWIVFPTRTFETWKYVAPMTCTADWREMYQGLERSLTKITETENGPGYYYEFNPDVPPVREHWRVRMNDYNYREYCNYEENWVYENGEADGSLGDIVVQQRVLYGMGEDSWCLVRIPTAFGPSETTTISSELGNLTYVTDWEIYYEQSDMEHLYLTYHGVEDIWPWWTNDFHMTNVIAPFGEQSEYRLQS